MKLEDILPHVPVFPGALCASDIITDMGVAPTLAGILKVEELLRAARPLTIGQSRPAEDTVWSRRRA